MLDERIPRYSYSEQTFPKLLLKRHLSRVCPGLSGLVQACPGLPCLSPFGARLAGKRRQKGAKKATMVRIRPISRPTVRQCHPTAARWKALDELDSIGPSDVCPGRRVRSQKAPRRYPLFSEKLKNSYDDMTTDAPASGGTASSSPAYPSPRMFRSEEVAECRNPCRRVSALLRFCRSCLGNM